MQRLAIPPFHLCDLGFGLVSIIQNKLFLHVVFSVIPMTGTEKYVYHVYQAYRSTEGTLGTCIFALLLFLCWLLQQFNSPEASGHPGTTDSDLVGIFQLVGICVLLDIRAKTLG